MVMTWEWLKSLNYCLYQNLQKTHIKMFSHKKTLPCIPCQPAQATPVANNRPSHVHSWDTRPRCPTRETLVVAELAPGELP